MNTYEQKLRDVQQNALQLQSEFIAQKVKNKSNFKPSAIINPEIDLKEQEKVVMGEFFQSLFTGKTQVKQTLSLNPGSGGENFLTETLAPGIRDKNAERFKLNQLVPYLTISTNSFIDSIAWLNYTFSDDDLLKNHIDDVTASFIELKGSEVTFKRHKSKIDIEISETISIGTNEITNLAQKVIDAGSRAIGTREVLQMFNQTPAKEQEHFSLYATSAITQGAGSKDTYEAILNAIKALPEPYKTSAIVVMSENDFLDMRATLAKNGLATLTSTAQELFLRETIFVESAKTPVVGDFSFYHINYQDAYWEQDKDVKSGVYQNVLTVYYDSNFFPPAFRLANILP